jgi:hypothetical protein
MTTAQVPLSQVTSESASTTQASESGQGPLNYTDAGTPTVQFQQRRSLSLVSFFYVTALQLLQ